MNLPDQLHLWDTVPNDWDVRYISSNAWSVELKNRFVELKLSPIKPSLSTIPDPSGKGVWHYRNTYGNNPKGDYAVFYKYKDETFGNISYKSWSPRYHDEFWDIVAGDAVGILTDWSKEWLDNNNLTPHITKIGKKFITIRSKEDSYMWTDYFVDINGRVYSEYSVELEELIEWEPNEDTLSFFKQRIRELNWSSKWEWGIDRYRMDKERKMQRTIWNFKFQGIGKNKWEFWWCYTWTLVNETNEPLELNLDGKVEKWPFTLQWANNDSFTVYSERLSKIFIIDRSTGKQIQLYDPSNNEPFVDYITIFYTSDPNEPKPYSKYPPPKGVALAKRP